MHTIRGAAALLLVGSLPGCWMSGRFDVYTCEDPCGNGLPASACEEPCKTCPGECVPLPPLGFGDHALLWVGDERLAPGCPPEAPKIAFEGHTDLNDSFECAPCRCGEPTCVLPRGLDTSTSPMCQGPDFTPFDAPSDWNGDCVSPATVPPDGVSSILIPPPQVSGCQVVVDDPPRALSLLSPWRTFARACKGEMVLNACGNPGETCAPKADDARSPGFLQCVHFISDDAQDCPKTYPEKYVLYGGLEDTRRCTACECGPPEGSVCSVLVSAYEEERCSTLLGAESSTLAGPKCVGGPEMRLGSMKAEWITNEPGRCAASGGERVGQLTPTSPTLFCCQATPDVGAP